MSIPITIIGGYLGAGKTTLINRLLNHQSDLSGLAILVNDFGDVNIDAKLIGENTEDDQVIGLTNGCVCCTIQDDFSASLEILKNRDIKHILFEASGVASPAKLRAQCSYPGFHPTSVFVLVDATQYAHQKRDKYIGHLVQQQVGEADTLVITKSTIDDIAGSLNQSSIIRHIDDPMLFEDLLSAQPQLSQAFENTPDNDHAFVTTTLSQYQPVAMGTLENWLNDLPGWVTRIKGFVLTDRGTVLVQGTGEHRELAEHDSAQAVTDAHQLVLITAQSHRLEELQAFTDQWPGARRT